MSGVPPYLDPKKDAGIIGLLSDPNFGNYCICYNNFRFGGGFNGTYWKEIDGLDISTMRMGDSGRPRDTGEFTGYDFLGGRDLIFKGDVANGGDPNPTFTMQQNLNIIGSAFLPQANVETPLYLYLPGQTASYIDNIVHGATDATGAGPGPIMNPPILQVTGRPRNRSWKIDIAFALGRIAQDIQLAVHCTDPRLYQYPTHTAYFENDPVVLTNSGNWDCRPIVYLMSPPSSGAGEVENPSLQVNNNVMTWGSQIFNNMFLVVDLYNQTVTQYLAKYAAYVGASCAGAHLTDLNGSYALTASVSGAFADFANTGKAYLQTNEGLATFSYSGQDVPHTTLYDCEYLSGNFDSGVELVEFGMILQDDDAGIQLTQTPYIGALQAGAGGWTDTNWGSLLPSSASFPSVGPSGASGSGWGENTIQSSNCLGMVNWASAWIL